MQRIDCYKAWNGKKGLSIHEQFCTLICWMTMTRCVAKLISFRICCCGYQISSARIYSQQDLVVSDDPKSLANLFSLEVFGSTSQKKLSDYGSVWIILPSLQSGLHITIYASKQNLLGTTVISFKAQARMRTHLRRLMKGKIWITKLFRLWKQIGG